jgi:hypothetical protein
MLMPMDSDSTHALSHNIKPPQHTQKIRETERAMLMPMDSDITHTLSHNIKPFLNVQYITPQEEV